MNRIGLFLVLVAFPIYKLTFVDQQQFEGNAWAAWYLGAEAIIAVVCLLAMRRDGEALGPIVAIKPRPGWWWTVLLVGLGAVAVLLVLRHTDVLVIAAKPGQDYGALAASDTTGRLISIVGSAIGVPLEEFIWRAFAITRLMQLGLGRVPAVILPAVAFGAFHGGSIDMLYVAVIVGAGAVLLGAVFLRTKSIAWPILIHFTWNVFLVALTPA